MFILDRISSLNEYNSDCHLVLSLSQEFHFYNLLQCASKTEPKKLINPTR